MHGHTADFLKKYLCNKEPFQWCHLQRSGILSLLLNFDPSAAFLLVNEFILFCLLMSNSSPGLWLREQQETSGSLATTGLCGDRFPVELQQMSTLNPGCQSRPMCPALLPEASSFPELLRVQESTALSPLMFQALLPGPTELMP